MQMAGGGVCVFAAPRNIFGVDRESIRELLQVQQRKKALMEHPRMPWRTHFPWALNWRGCTLRTRFHRVRLLAAQLISASSAALISLAIAAPLLESIRVPAAQRIYWLLSFICHQIPSRSPMILGSNVGLCFRCMAIYASLAAGMALPLSAVVKRLSGFSNGMLRLTLNQSTAVIAGVFILVLLTDGLLPMFGWPLSTNPRRVVTGLLGGWAIASLLVMPRDG